MDDIFYPLHSFKEQLDFDPVIINEGSLLKKSTVVISGMGGSAISVSLLKILYPHLTIQLHNGYGLPTITDTSNTLLIINSYSGDTEEELEVLKEGTSHGVACAVLSRGGELIRLAQEQNLPHIVLPSIGVEPRFAIGHQIISLLTLMQEFELILPLKEKIRACNLAEAEQNGKLLAESIHGKYPILYASKELFPIAYLVKAAINEGAKLPCFANTIPEANHNEIQSFISNETKKESSTFIFVMYRSSKDHPRIQKRFTIMSELYAEEGFGIATVEGDHTNHTKIFELILAGYFTATYLGIARNVDTYKTPFIAKFKNILS